MGPGMSGLLLPHDSELNISLPVRAMAGPVRTQPAKLGELPAEEGVRAIDLLDTGMTLHTYESLGHDTPRGQLVKDLSNALAMEVMLSAQVDRLRSGRQFAADHLPITEGGLPALQASGTVPPMGPVRDQQGIAGNSTMLLLPQGMGGPVDAFGLVSARLTQVMQAVPKECMLMAAARMGSIVTIGDSEAVLDRGLAIREENSEGAVTGYSEKGFREVGPLALRKRLLRQAQDPRGHGLLDCDEAETGAVAAAAVGPSVSPV